MERLVNSIRILLVEDEAPKCMHIQHFLESLRIGMVITVSKSVNAALDELENELPDMLILDMSLPTFDIGDRESGGRPQGFGGIEVLRHMSMAGMECPTIVITGYEAFQREAGKAIDLSQIRSELAEEFPTMFKGILHYNSTYDEWKTALKKALVDFGIRTETCT